jgi:DNA-binding SARP family transcriptional activator
MLASRRGSDVPRDQLIEHLWPEMDDQRALNNFYVAWSAMKRALMPVPLREVPCPYVEHVGGICRAIAGRVSTDVSEFDDLLAAARKARAAGDIPAELESLLQAGELYRGDVMPGDAYDDWFASLRERCRHDFEDAMLRACDLLESRGDGRVGLGLVRRALEYDPWREDLYQAALRLQIGCGQRSAAIDTYMSCRSHLVDDLGIDPSARPLVSTRRYSPWKTDQSNGSRRAAVSDTG